jgi:MFS family permease
MFMLISELSKLAWTDEKFHAEAAAGGGMFLLGHSNEDDVMRLQKAHGLMMNFIMMSVCFSVNSGAAVTVIALCTAHLGGLLGSLILAIFNTMYVLTGLVFQSVVVEKLGMKGSLVTGTVLYCTFCLFFLLAFTSEESSFQQWCIAIVGALAGGFGAGFLWSAQGAYFALNAEQYAAAAGVPKEQATGRLSVPSPGTHMRCVACTANYAGRRASSHSASCRSKCSSRRWRPS